jgi:PrtD family type I secretion system ABC transporter
MTHQALHRILSRHRSSFAMLWLFSVFFNVLVLVLPLYMLAIFSNVLTSRSQDTLLLLTGAAILALLIQAGLDFIRSRLLIRVGVTLDAQLTPQVLDSVIRQAAGAPRRSAQRLRDAVELRSFLTGPGIFNLFDAPFVPLYVLVIYLLHPMLGHLALAGSLLLIVIAIGNEMITRRPIAAALKGNRHAQRRVEEFVRNADAITAMGMMPAVVAQWRQRNGESLIALARGTDSASISRALAKFARLLLQVGLYGLGAYLYLQNEIMIGAIVAGSMLMGRALAPLEVVISTWKSMVDAWDAYHRIDETLDAQAHQAARQPMAFGRPQGALQLERVVVGVPGSDRLTLKGVSLTLAAGEFLGVIGPSGAGKSTLAKVITGITAPRAGAVRLDGIERSQRDPDELGTRVGYLPQDLQLFGGTVRQNIARLASDPIDDAAVLRAAMMAGVHEAILRLPDGYDTDIGEAGALLSAGQRQHLALARALYGDPCLVVLDEPNSNLDSAAEDALLKALEQARSQGVTLVVVSHRPGILQAADKLLMLRNGVVELFGPRAQVMRQLAAAAAAPASGVSAMGSVAAVRSTAEPAAQPKLQVVQGEN